MASRAGVGWRRRMVLEEGDMTAKIALITGAANGIGAATARRLAKDGYKVALFDRLASGQAVADELGSDTALFIQGDVSRPQDVESGVAKAIKHFGGLDVLVNNAGVSLPKSLADTTTDDWDICTRSTCARSTLV